MPYIRIKTCVYKKTKKGNKGKKKGCSKSTAKAKSYFKKLHMVGEEINIEIKNYLGEGPKDAKILRNINIDFLKKEVVKEPDEEVRDYFARLQKLERENPPVFPVELVNWIEGLDDRYFPRDGRKIFAKWLGNAVWHEEAEERSTRGAPFSGLDLYNNDIRYIVDYLNGADNVPKEAWSLTFPQMTYAAEEWHEQLSDIPEVTGDYGTKKVAHNFENGYTIVEVPSEDLEAEGNKMGHCVGSYCDAVESKKTTIYSLRDAKNEPHVTIEVVQDKSEGHIYQIKGKGNDPPVEKYRGMVKQWVQNNFEPHQYLQSDGVEDYMALLDRGEILPLLTSEQVDPWVVTNLLKKTRDPELIDHFLNLERKPGRRPQPALAAMIENPSLNKSQAERLLILELLNGFAGAGIDDLFTTAGRSEALGGPNARNAEEFFDRAWQFSQRYGYKKNSTWIVGSILKHTKKSELREEIMKDLFSAESIQRIGASREDEQAKFEKTGHWEGIDSSGALYRGAVHTYLGHGDTRKAPNKEMVQRVYNATRTGTVISKHAFGNGTHQIDILIAKNPAVTTAMIEELIKSADSDPGGEISRGLVENPVVPEKYKYGIIQKFFKSRSASWINLFGKSVYRTIEHGWNDGNYSEKFLRWLLDAGVFEDAVKEAVKHKWLDSIESSSFFDDPPTEGKEYEKMRIEVIEMLRKKIAVVAKRGPEPPGRSLYSPGPDQDLNEAIQTYLEDKIGKSEYIEEDIDTQAEDLEENNRDREVIEGWLTEMLEEP